MKENKRLVALGLAGLALALVNVYLIIVEGSPAFWVLALFGAVIAWKVYRGWKVAR